MAEVRFIGMGDEDRGKPGTFAHAMDRMLKAGSDYETVFDDIGRQSVTKTVDYLLSNRVRPPTTRAVFDRRRRPRKGKGPNEKDITLVDTGIGKTQVIHSADSGGVTVGVPSEGYMAYHQDGRVPNAPRRKFLMLLTSEKILRIVNFHWKKAIRS